MEHARQRLASNTTLPAVPHLPRAAAQPAVVAAQVFLLQLRRRRLQGQALLNESRDALRQRGGPASASTRGAGGRQSGEGAASSPQQAGLACKRQAARQQRQQTKPSSLTGGGWPASAPPPAPACCGGCPRPPGRAPAAQHTFSRECVAKCAGRVPATGTVAALFLLPQQEPQPSPGLACLSAASIFWMRRSVMRSASSWQEERRSWG